MKKYNSIDLFKVFMAVFVVAIHTQPFIEEKYYLYSLIIHSAVPFFFMCSGYLLYSKIQVSNDDYRIVILNYVKKIAQLYLIWSIIYLPITIYSFIIHKHSFFNFFKIIIGYLLKGEQYYSWPLWYLLCTVYSLLLLLFFKKIKIRNKYIFLISFVFLIIGELYTFYISNINLYSGLLYQIFKVLRVLFGGSGGRLFQGLFYICFGILIKKKKLKVNKYLAFVMMFFVIVINYFLKFFLLKVLFDVFVFIWCINISLKDNFIYYYFRKSSSIIYFTHMLFFFIYTLIVGYDKCKGLGGFLATILCCILICFILLFFNRKRKLKFFNHLFS